MIIIIIIIIIIIMSYIIIIYHNYIMILIMIHFIVSVCMYVSLMLFPRPPRLTSSIVIQLHNMAAMS